MGLQQLYNEWQKASLESDDRMRVAGRVSPSGDTAVTKENMRFLVLQWVIEIDRAKQET
jgi:hypothetical protein